MTFQLLYRSTSLHTHWHPSDLDILRQAIANNSKFGICGLLLRDRSNFYQVLEGSEMKVTQLFGAIKKDARHTDIECLLSHRIMRPIFSRWSMGYQVAELSTAPKRAANSMPGDPGETAEPMSILAQIEQLARAHVCTARGPREMIEEVKMMNGSGPRTRR